MACILNQHGMLSRRVVGDMVDDMDMKRKKSLALVTGRTDSETDLGPSRRPLQAQRSRSSRVLC